MRRQIISVLTALVCSIQLTNAETHVLTLDSCRALAIRNNNDLKMADAKKQKAYYDRKAAFTKFLPRITATGAYILSSRDISLLSEETQDKLNNLGTNAGTAMGQSMQQMTQQGMQQMMQEAMQNPALLQMMMQNPQLAQMMQNMPGMAQNMTQSMANNLSSAMAPKLNAIGSDIVKEFEIDNTNVGVISVMLTQPLYMGGKIAAYHNIMKKVEQLNTAQAVGKENDVIVETDEAYWRIVGLQSKKRLAESYLRTIDTLNKDVDRLIEAGFATKADGLKVKVKLNEAKVSVIQVENGITLSKMLLCQICGLDMNSDIELADINIDAEGFVVPETSSAANVEEALNARYEMQSLALAKEIGEEKVKIARSEYLPTLALMGGYTTTNPSAFDGIKNEFGGMWNVGVVLKVPVVTCGERIYKVRAAKEEARIAEYQYDEAKEKITLQVNQNMQKVTEASERLQTAKESLKEAQENLRYAEVGLKEGMIPVSDVLQAETALLKAQSTAVEAEIDLLLADLYLKKSLGKIQSKGK
ncbi:MAG: TolC family protein [Paludibacteraceae bacterium]|nr:TolC family protein [Paludibacteraceae bacterium]